MKNNLLLSSGHQRLFSQAVSGRKSYFLNNETTNQIDIRERIYLRIDTLCLVTIYIKH